MAGRVSLVVLDNGATSIQVGSQNVQLVVGCSSAGTVNAPFASTSPNNIVTNFGYGPLPEAMALVAAVGGVPIGVKTTQNAAGSSSAVTAGAGNTGTSVMTVSVGAAFDTYYVLVTCTLAGTIGTGPVSISISLDAGRTTSPSISLGTATTYAIPNTGLTLSFSSLPMGLGDTYTFGTHEPQWAAAGVQAAINAFLASQYKQTGIGSAHIVGGGTTASTGAATGADMVSIGGYLQTARQNQYVFTRAYISARDASPAAKWGGTGETEATWMTAISTDYQGQALNNDTTGRTSPCAAYWNIQSALTNGLGLSPRFRRSIAYALAQRQVQIPPQRMPSRVKDGALAPVVISPADKSDGFVYHDEAISPGLDATKGGSGGFFTTTTTIQGKNGIFAQHANLFSPTGSQYGYMPRGLVVDIACSIAYQVGITEIDNDVRLTPTNTMDPRDAQTIQDLIRDTIKANMTDAGMLTSNTTNPFGCTVVIDPTVVIGGPTGTGNVAIQVSINGKGYILAETISVGYSPGS